jgi:hypothetical protein
VETPNRSATRPRPRAPTPNEDQLRTIIQLHGASGLMPKPDQRSGDYEYQDREEARLVVLINPASRTTAAAPAHRKPSAHNV